MREACIGGPLVLPIVRVQLKTLAYLIILGALPAANTVSAEKKVADFVAPLVRAVVENDEAAVSKAISLGANVDAKDTVTGIAPLVFASSRGYLNIVKLLLNAGANVNVTQGPLDWTPLHSAVYANRSEVTKYLLNNGASLSPESTYGDTPFALGVKRASDKALESFAEFIALKGNAGEWKNAELGAKKRALKKSKSRSKAEAELSAYTTRLADFLAASDRAASGTRE